MKPWKKGNWKGMGMCCGQPSGAVYGFGFLGALVFYLQHALTAGDMLLGVVKAVIWPAMIVYRVIEMLKI